LVVVVDPPVVVDSVAAELAAEELDAEGGTVMVVAPGAVGAELPASVGAPVLAGGG